MSVNRHALERVPTPMRPNSSRGEYKFQPSETDRGGDGTKLKAYSCVTESIAYGWLCGMDEQEYVLATVNSFTLSNTSAASVSRSKDSEKVSNVRHRKDMGHCPLRV